ncbi:LOW QUALITY PROTEIN: tudor domain-containing protein 1 [Ranitomeya variabilis]|uniref:LOW QUALITY PROTEIN: tudor domain-containing protein 1 n=1 Tax=Ranitomeya variabilis TaxID=490064 RepID=UPI0040575F50
MAHLSGFYGNCAAEAKKAASLRDTMAAVDNDCKLFGTLKPVTRTSTCHNCGLTGSSRCSRCHQTSYCSVQCQKQDWTSHSVICRPADLKETDGNNPLNGANIVSRGCTKTEASRSPDPKHEEVTERKIRLCDLQKEPLSQGTEFQGFVVEFSSPSNFFVKAVESKSMDKLMEMSSSLQNLYSDPSALKKGYTPDTGEVCVAKYNKDQQWYRALMYNVEATMRTAQVLYLDYGNTETLSLDSVQPMHRDVELLPPCALHCSLAHVTAPPFGWTPECLVEVKHLLVGQKLLICVADVVHGELPRYSVHVSLFESGEDVHKIIIEKGYSFPPLNRDHGKVEDPEKVPTLMTQTEMPDLMPAHGYQDGATHKPEILSASLRVGDRFETLITEIHDPEMFFCQQVQNAKQLDDLMVMMHNRYSSSAASPQFSPAPGDICAAQFSEDSKWYRASVVRHISGDSVFVGYLDFGNTEILPTSHIRPIEPELLSVPFQAAQCSLAGVKPPSGKWSSEATDSFRALVTNKTLSASIVANCDRVLTLELTDDSAATNLSISQHLIMAGLAIPSTAACEATSEEDAGEDRAVPLRWTTLSPGKQTEVSVCMLQNPGDFFCHVHNHTDLQLLNQLNESLRQYCTANKAEGYDPARDEICGAYYAGDGNWYRAQVKDSGPGNTAKILFVDYGNTDDVSVDNLCKIPSSFLELPFQAVCCSLSGVKPDGETWSEDSVKTFQKSVVGVKLLAKAVEPTKHGVSVELAAIEGGTISDLLLAANCAVRDEKSVKEKVEVTANQALRPLRNPLPTVKAIPAPNQVRGDVRHQESRSGETSHVPATLSSPPDPIPAALRRSLCHLQDSKQLLTPRDLTAAPPGGREIHVIKSVPSLSEVRYPKSIPSAVRDPAFPTLRPSNNSSGPKAPSGSESIKPFPKVYVRGAAAPLRGLSPKSVPMGLRPFRALAPTCMERLPGPLSSSSHQAKSIPATSRESSFTTAASASPGAAPVNKPPVPGESRSFASPPPVPPPLIQDASIVDPSNPNNYKSAPSTSRESQPGNSAPTANGASTTKRGESPIHLSPSEESSHGEMKLHDKPVTANSAAGCHLPGVSAAQSWISVDLPVNRALPACVLTVISPDLFYVFPKENRVDVSRLHQVMMEIHQYCSTETDAHNYRPSAGDACCAKFTEDGQWYRAVVLQVQDSSAKIAYADYGNVEVLPFSCLLPMKKSFLELPMQLTKCCLADVLPVTEPWSPDAARTLSSLLLGADVLITASSFNAGIYRVSVDKQQESGVLHVAERLVADGLARNVPLTRCPGISGGCCCGDLLKRVEKLEEIILQLLPTEKIQ